MTRFRVELTLVSFPTTQLTHTSEADEDGSEAHKVRRGTLNTSGSSLCIVACGTPTYLLVQYPMALTPAQTPPTSSRAYLPIDQWDSDVLFKAHLLRVHEPTVYDVVDLNLTRARALWLKRQIRDLERLKASVAPRHSSDIETELSGCRLRRKILVWYMFPIQRLPEEILVQILRLVLQSSRSPSEATTHRLHLTWVCRMWREITINDKVLWSHIWIRDRPPYTRSLAWIDRAGSAPMEIRITEIEKRHGETADPPKITAGQMAVLLDKILVKIATIHVMFIIVDTWPPALVALHKLRDAGVPLMMERFEIHRVGHPYAWTLPGVEPDEVRNPIALFNGCAPKLKWLTINGLNIDWYRSPLSNLVTLDMRRMLMPTCPSMTRFRQMLANCPRLYRLAIDASGPRWEQEGEMFNPIHMPSIRELLIGDVSVRYATFIISQIIAPRIMCLNFMNMNGEDFGPLIAYLVGRFPLVEILTLFSIAVLDDTRRENVNMGRLVAWLRSMPKLKILKIAHISPPMLDAFLEDPRDHFPPTEESELEAGEKNEEEREVLCPELRFFQLTAQVPNQILKFTQTRKALGVPLTRIYVTAKDIYNSEMRQLLPQISASVGEFYATSSISCIEEESIVHKQANAEDEIFFTQRSDF